MFLRDAVCFFTQELSWFFGSSQQEGVLTVLGKDLNMTEVCAGQTQPWEDEVICIYLRKKNPTKQEKIIAWAIILADISVLSRMGTTSSLYHTNLPHWSPPSPRPMCCHPSLSISVEEKTSSLTPQKSAGDFFFIFSPAQTPSPSPNPSEKSSATLSSTCTPGCCEHPAPSQPCLVPLHHSQCWGWGGFGFLLSPTLLVDPLEVVDVVPSLSGMFLSLPQKCCPISRVPGWKYNPNHTHSTFGKTPHKSQLRI